MRKELSRHLKKYNGRVCTPDEVRKIFGKIRARMPDYPSEFNRNDLIHLARRKGILVESENDTFRIVVEEGA